MTTEAATSPLPVPDHHRNVGRDTSGRRSSVLFRAMMIAVAVTVAAEVAGIWHHAVILAGLTRQATMKRAELGRLLTSAPPLTPETSEFIAADRTAAEAQVAAMTEALKAEGRDHRHVAVKPSATLRTDAFFELAGFVERMRDLAERQHVEVRPQAARFGFARYAHDAPETEQVATILEQREALEFVVSSLLAASPHALLAVQRERLSASAGAAPISSDRGVGPTSSRNSRTTQRSGAAEASDDFFALAVRASARMRGYVDTMAFRVVFSGDTANLRAFLNRMGAGTRPIVIREIVVDRDPDEPPPSSRAAGASDSFGYRPASSVVLTSTADSPEVADEPTPIVIPQRARFSVTVEFVELVSAKPSAAPSVDERARPAAMSAQSAPPAVFVGRF